MSLEKFNVDNIYFKWPNDIFHMQKKFAGIISEIIKFDEEKSYTIIGIGINVAASTELKKYKATYLNSFCDTISINAFLKVLIEIIFLNLKELQLGKTNKMMKFFSNSLMFINKKIIINLPNNTKKKGIFKGINNDGSLILQINNTIENIYNGSIDL